jgi:Na+-driven multidrug efflux pump
MRNVFGFFGSFTWAFAATSNTMVSNLMGQNRPEAIPALLRKIVTISMSFSFLIAAFLTLFPHLFLGLFGQSDDFIQTAIPVLHVVCIALILMSASTVYLNAVTGTGNSRITFMIEVCAVIIYAIYVFEVLDRYFLSITIGWMSEWIYWILLLIPSFFYMRSKRWQHKKI